MKNFEKIYWSVIEVWKKSREKLGHLTKSVILGGNIRGVPSRTLETLEIFFFKCNKKGNPAMNFKRNLGKSLYELLQKSESSPAINCWKAFPENHLNEIPERTFVGFCWDLRMEL